MIGTAQIGHLRAALLAMAMLAAALVALAGAKPARAAFPEGQGPVAFEKDEDVWVATRMHLVNLSPDTVGSTELDFAVSPDGRYVAFASDGDGDFEIYVAHVFTGKAHRVTDNAVDDHNPVWSPDGHWISYLSPHYGSPTHSGIFLANVEGVQGYVAK